MTDEIKFLAEWVSPTFTDPQMSPNMLSFYFGSGFNIDLFLGTLAAQVLVMYYQGDCSSGQLSLIGFRLLVVLPPLEWKRMSDPVMVSLWCSWINMGFGVRGPGFRKVYTLPLIICVTLGKSPNLLKPVLSVKNNFKKRNNTSYHLS